MPASNHAAPRTASALPSWQTGLYATGMTDWPDSLPEQGLGEEAVLAALRPMMAARSTALGSTDALAHMDPPPPPIAAEVTGLNAALNQNLLHPDLSPLATEAEARVIDWLAPHFGVGAGHMCGGSTLANLTALWAAREHGARRVVASAEAHLSVPKAAHILGMAFEKIPVDTLGRLEGAALPGLEDAALVLTAGSTGRGVVDPLARPSECRWLHVDAAWAGPLRLTRHAGLLDGIEQADSVAISAHKWFFQPKDSGIVLFRDPAAEARVSFGGSYLARPNIGVQGSRGAVALPLVATLLAWGRTGLAARLEKSVADAEALADRIAADPRLELRQPAATGVLNWRPLDGDAGALAERLRGTSSTLQTADTLWIRQVAANPAARVDAVWARIEAALAP
ncbi:MAG: pyridoxal-dependent decarboxylase [Pseudomonadota bacterium]